MMGFLLKELARTALFTRLARTLVALGASAVIVMVLGLVALVTQEGSRGRLLVLFQPEVSSDQIIAIYRHVSEWETVSEVRYISPEDPERARDLLDISRVPAGYLSVTVRRFAERAELENALRALSGVAAVESHRRSALGEGLASLGSVLLGSVFLGGGLVVFGLLLTGLSALRGAWAGELETLYWAGVSASTVRGAFLIWAVGMGVASALVGVLFITLLRILTNTPLWLPEVEQPGGVRYATLVMLGVGSSVGALAGAILALRLRR
ncbi:MAG: hypothetical protein NZO41_03860 [Candidatus Bipolaricaulota bacterium]|nr:hypothetical protein [Candidatus Bipolaricaulota bacterium]MDW8141489.1 hypothetical protein [Candidatus Bipolaricaulota bacterium]